MSETHYYLFGFIKLWSVKRDLNEDELYKKMSERFKKELNDAVIRQSR